MKEKWRVAMTVAAVCVMTMMCLVGCGITEGGSFWDIFTGAASGVGVEAPAGSTEASTSGSSTDLTYVSGQAVEIEEYDALELVDLAEYKGIDVDCKATDEEIQQEIDSQLSQTPNKIKEGTAASGMSVNIDYSGKKDGKKFDGGTAEDQTIELGNSGMIPGFDDAIIGMKVGEKKDCPMTFPKDYHTEDLAGKDVVFTIKLNYITGHELTEDYVKENTEYKSIAEYKDSLKKSLVDSKKAAASTTALQEVVSKSTVKSVPPTLLLAEKEMMRCQMENQMAQYGMTIDQALESTGQTPEQFEEYLTQQAQTMTETELIMEAIALKENVDLSETAINAYLEEMGKQSQDGTVDSIKKAYEEYYGVAMPFEHYIRSSYIYKKVSELVGNAANLIE